MPKKLIASGILSNHDTSTYLDFSSHIAKYFGTDWVLYNAINNGIGIHHGLIPKYIQKEIINLFNTGFLKVLISTTTITEGVNTSAKNLVVLHSKKGTKDLKKFDAKNIAGRAGRFLYHYSGE
jgi:replicative superfamily II helicase